MFLKVLDTLFPFWVTSLSGFKKTVFFLIATLTSPVIIFFEGKKNIKLMPRFNRLKTFNVFNVYLMDRLNIVIFTEAPIFML